MIPEQAGGGGGRANGRSSKRYKCHSSSPSQESTQSQRKLVLETVAAFLVLSADSGLVCSVIASFPFLCSRGCPGSLSPCLCLLSVRLSVCIYTQLSRCSYWVSPWVRSTGARRLSLVYQGGQSGARRVVPYLILADPVAAEQGSELQRSCSKSCPTFWQTG